MFRFIIMFLFGLFWKVYNAQKEQLLSQDEIFVIETRHYMDTYY